MNKYIGPIKWLGGIAALLFVFALIFEPLTQGLSEDARKSVLLHAVPFFATFVGILLLFILVITLVAIQFNGRVPWRTYQAIELSNIFGIFLGVICLFQPWSDIPYRYGFLLVLVSTLSFILWSHLVPKNTGDTEEIVGLSTWQRLIAVASGLLAGLLLSFDPRPIHGFYVMVLSILGYFLWSRTFKIPEDSTVSSLRPQDKFMGLLLGGTVAILMVATLIALSAPQPPYGLRERTYNSYNDERKAQVAVDANSKFWLEELPFIIILSLFPGMLIYFVSREVVNSRRSHVQRVSNTPVTSLSGSA
jgi:hypothetical protein